MIDYLPGLCDEARNFLERLVNPEFQEITALAEEDPIYALAKIAVIRGEGREVPVFLASLEKRLAPDGNFMDDMYEFHKSITSGKK